MMEEKAEIEILFQKMMKDFEETSRNDEIYREDIEDFGALKIQWRLCGIYGYQILELDNYSYEFGVKLDNPDVTFIMRDPEDTIKFLKGEHFPEFGVSPRTNYNGLFRFKYTNGWFDVDDAYGKRKLRSKKHILSVRYDKDKEYHPFLLRKLPMFKRITKEVDTSTPDGEFKEYGSYIPINTSLGTFENQVLPLKVFKHFFDKASNIIQINECWCRAFKACEKHDHDIGCVHLGDDTKSMVLPEKKGRVITSEEAFEIAKRAVAQGLVPVLGRSRGEASGNQVDDTGHFMTMCYCCDCCCVNANSMTHGTIGQTRLTRMFVLAAEIVLKCVNSGA